MNGIITMSESLELVYGSGNVYRDLGDPDADLRQTKALLALEIIKILDNRKLTTRKAEEMTGIDHSDFVRIRKPDLKRFTIDRLITILNKLEFQVDVNIAVMPFNQKLNETVLEAI